MSFTEGKPKGVKLTFTIRAKTKSTEARKKELRRFHADVKKLAKKYRGKVK